jgi:hypothetical protein
MRVVTDLVYPPNTSFSVGVLLQQVSYSPMDAFSSLRLVQFCLGLVGFVVAPLVQLKTTRL